MTDTYGHCVLILNKDVHYGQRFSQCARSFPFVRSELPSVLCTRLWLVTLTTTTPPPCRHTHTLSVFSRDEREILPPRRQLFVVVFSIFQRDGQRERGQSTGVTGAFGLSQCRCLPDRVFAMSLNEYDDVRNHGEQAEVTPGTKEVELNQVRSQLFAEPNRDNNPQRPSATVASLNTPQPLPQTDSSSNRQQLHRQASTGGGDNDTPESDLQLPLEIQLALLEDTVFGWTHLTSTFMGHTLLPLVAYWMMHQLIEWLLSRWYGTKQTGPNEEATQWTELVARACGVTAGYAVFRFIRQRRRVWLRSAYGSRAYQQDRVYRRRSVHQADRSNTLGRLMHRIQRKRRRRKLQKAKIRYAKRHMSRVTESGGYRISDDEKEEQTHQRSPSKRALFPRSPAASNVAASRNYSSTASREQDKITQSEASSFSSADNPMTSFSDDDTDTPTSTCRRATLSTMQQPTSITQDHVAIPLIQNVAYAHGGFFGAAPFVLASPRWVRILRKLLPDVYVEISRRVLFSPAPKLIHWAENNPVVAAYGVVQFIRQREQAWEQQQQRPCLQQHEKALSPTPSSEDCDTIQKATPEDPLRPMETSNDSEGDPSNFPTIEWDIFLDPRLVRRVEAVLEAKEKYLRDNPPSPPLRKQHMSPPPKERYVNDGLFRDDEGEREGLLLSPSIDNKNTQKVLEYLDNELQKRAQELTDQLLIAHGNTTQLILEQTGYFKDWNYSRVQRTRQSLGGGMYARQWMAVFAEALRLATKFDDDAASPHNYFTTSMEDMAWLLNDDDGRDEDDFSTYLDYSLDTTMSDSLELIKRITQTQHPMSLVLDLKSRHVPKRVLGVVVDTLCRAGIHVEGIASFQISEIRGVSRYVTRNHPDEGAHPHGRKTKELLFVHSAGDLRDCCEQGLVRPGDHVFFNGGSLILESARQSALASLFRLFMRLGFDGFDPKSIQGSYRLHSCAIPNHRLSREDTTSSESSPSPLNTSMISLHDYKRLYRFSMGVYVQEFSIDEAAARLLIEHVNDNPEVYDLGFAWGGVNGMTVKGIKPGRFTSTDGLWNQRHLAKLWT